MRRVRKICVALILIFYACAVFPVLMGWYNRPETIFGLPCFAVGLLSLAFGMLFTLLFLYYYELKKEEGKGE